MMVRYTIWGVYLELHTCDIVIHTRTSRLTQIEWYTSAIDTASWLLINNHLTIVNHAGLRVTLLLLIKPSSDKVEYGALRLSEVHSHRVRRCKLLLARIKDPLSGYHNHIICINITATDLGSLEAVATSSRASWCGQSTLSSLPTSTSRDFWSKPTPDLYN